MGCTKQNTAETGIKNRMDWWSRMGGKGGGGGVGFTIRNGARARVCVSARFALGRSSPLSPSFTKLFSLFLPTFSVCFAKRKANDEAKDRREERKELCVCTSTHKGRDNVG